MYHYPYGNAQQLNLDWFLAHFKEIMLRLSTLEEDLMLVFAERLLAAIYDQYEEYVFDDIVYNPKYRKLYRALRTHNAGDEWNPDYWEEILVCKELTWLLDKVGFSVLNTNAQDLSAAINELLAKFTPIEQTLDDIQTPMLEVTETYWEQGGISNSTGVENTNTNRLRTHDYLEVKPPHIFIEIEAGYQYSIREFDENKNFYQGSQQWLGYSDFYAFKGGKYFRVVIRKSDDSDIAPAMGRLVCTIFWNNPYNTTAFKNHDKSLLVKLQNLKRRTRLADGSFASVYPLSFIHFSDVHNDKITLENLSAFKKAYPQYIDDVLFTGDMVNNYTDGISFWNNTEGAENILGCIGNHDVYDGESTNWIDLTEAQAYQMYFAPYIENWGATYVQDVPYYYKDYTDLYNVRLIVLDAMHQTAAQLSWFQNVLSDALSLGRHVVVAAHTRIGWKYNSYITDWDDRPVSLSYNADDWTDKSTSFTSYPANLSNDYPNAVDTFISGGGKFVCWLHGHTHYRMFATLTMHPNQLTVSVGNAGELENRGTPTWARIYSTRSEDDFNVVSIDTYSGILRIMKVGVNYDRLLRHADTISYDYINHRILTNQTEPPVNLQGFKTYRLTNINNASTDTLEDLGIVGAGELENMVFFMQTVTTVVSSCSLYFVRRNANGYLVTPVLEGTAGTAPRIDNSTGVVHTNSNPSLSTIYCTVIKMSKLV